MAIVPSDFIISASPNPLRVVLGMNGTLNINFSNVNNVDRAYNLTLNMTLPDGVSFVSSTETPTSIIANMDGTISIEWLSIKDLAPNETDFSVGVTLKSDENFRNTLDPVPFDIPIDSIDISATVDTLPRGSDDPGNVKITKTESLDFIPLRYNLTKSSTGKIPKGAGLLSPVVDPAWPYEYSLKVMNNTREASEVSLIDELPNGVRYLDNLNVVGPDSSLSNPTVTIPSPGPGCQDFVTIDWGTVTLAIGSVYDITFDAAIWDNFTENCIENSGSRIPHMNPMENISTLDGLSGPVEANSITNAMDATINKSVASNQTDVGVINFYTLTYRINQYDNIEDFTITDIISDGQTYNSDASPITPDSITINPDGTTELIWNLGLLDTATSGTITFTTNVDSSFSGGNPVTADDTLSNEVEIDGINEITSTNTPDNSSAGIFILQPNIAKEILGYFYKDGTPKNIDVVAPGDIVRFKITYNATNLVASQVGIEVDEFAPINMGPLPAVGDVIFDGTLGPGPFNQQTVAPNGIRWLLGNLPGGSFWTATFDIPVKNEEFVGARNNLTKLSGQNTAGFSYSDRDQVEVEFGEPNIGFEKTVSGPNPNSIKAGETYTYSITISNPQNLEGNVTDAFEIDLIDTIPDKLTYVPGSAVVSGTGTFNPPVITGQDVSMTINKLAPDESLTLSFDVIVDNDIVAGESLINNAILQRPYSQPDRSYQFPGDPFTDETILKSQGLGINKVIDPTFAKIGDVVTYIIEVTVPEGLTAFNVQLVDTFPDSTQDFINGSATLDGNPVTPLSVAGGVVTFNAIPFIDATSAAVTRTYSFDVRVTDASQVNPYFENQLNSATVNWDLDDQGTPAPPSNTSANLEVRVPFLVGNKTQRNVTKATGFTTAVVDYEVGDIIEYSIDISNQGRAPAFDIELTDTLNSLLDFQAGTITTTKGTASETGGTITWGIDTIIPSETVNLRFQVITLPGIASGGSISNKGSFEYNSNNNGFGENYGPIDTNTVVLRSPQVSIDKTASTSITEIGDDINYTLTITVPNGTIAYKPLVEDILPTGQTYQTASAQRQEPPSPAVPVTPTIAGQTITFPQNPDIDATGGERTIIYTFTARVTSGNTNPPYTVNQINTGRVRWALSSGAPLTMTQTDQWTVTVRAPHIRIIKEQRNSTTGGSFTTENISGLPGDIIEYRLSVISDGASPAFNVNLEDILDSRVTFNSIVSGPSQGTIDPIIPPNTTLNWDIGQLNNGTTATVIFAVTIDSGIGAGSSIPDNATATYDSNDVNPITFNAESNTVILDIPLLDFTKQASKTTAAIGETITYSLTVSIPEGVEAYDIFITDSIPVQQSYVSGTWSPGTPTLLPGNVLQFTDTVSPRTGAYTQTYTFDVVVDSGQIDEPFVETQRNTAIIEWGVTNTGPIKSAGDFVDIDVKVPHISVLKEQRRDGETEFTTDVLLGVVTGDKIDYRITITNDGEAIAYNIVTTDELDNALTYLGVLPPSPPGTVTSSVSPGDPDGTITWTETTLGIGDSLSLIFQIEVNTGPSSGTAIFNMAESEYDSFNTNPTTLGPNESNQVGFNFTLPEINKTVNRKAFFVGDIATYTIEVTIPNGNIDYDVQVSDVLPVNQSYVSGTLTKDGIGITPFSLDPFIFEAPQTIDATSGAVTIVYSFQASIDSVSQSPEDIQTNQSTVNWNKSPGSDPGEPQSDSEDVFVTDNIVTIEKSQKNFTTDPLGDFTTDIIQAKEDDIIYYRYEITNPSSQFSIYNINFEDVLNQFLEYQGSISIPVDGTVINDSGVIRGTAGEILQSSTAVFILSFKVLAGSGAGSKIPNQFTALYDVNDLAPFLQYGPITSNIVELELPGLQVDKGATIDIGEIGQIFSYNIDITIPQGTIAYNIVVEDSLPLGQIYIGDAFIDGTHVFPTISGQQVIFNPITIDATNDEITITYSFKARIVEGNMNDPFTEIQQNLVEVNWDVDEEGTPSTTISATKDIRVDSPSFSILKEQRNVNGGDEFSINDISVEVGDILEFRITIKNTGAANAYNVNVSDILNQFDGFVSVVSISTGSASYDSGIKTVDWKVDLLGVGAEETLIFSIEILEGVSAGSSGTDTSTAFYDTNENNPITFGPIESNEVLYNYPLVEINKTSDIINASINDTITYTVTIIIPQGTVIYNGVFTDIIPIGQEYNGNATLNGSEITAEVNNHVIIFPTIPFIEATNQPIELIYTFESRVVSAIVDPITLIDSQTNDAEFNWDIEPGIPAFSVNVLKGINVTDSTISIIKEQRNVTEEGIFSEDLIEGVAGDIVEYRLIVENTGPNTVYDVRIRDNLSIDLSFNGEISVPIGTSLSHSGESMNGVVQWNIPQLIPGESLQVVFSVIILREIKGNIDNKTIGSFRITEDNPEFYGNLPSNITIIDVQNKFPIRNECIIVDKIYSHCQKRICFSNFIVNVPSKYKIERVKFRNGEIVTGSLDIKDIPSRENFKRITFEAKVDIEIEAKDNEGNTISIEESLPQYNIDIVNYMPNTRDEIGFKVKLDTSSRLLKIDDTNNSIAVGIFNNISIVLKVQLFIPTLSQGCIPPECENYVPADMCKDFIHGFAKNPFDNFYPYQY